MAENKIILRHEDFALDEDGEVAGASGGVSPGHLVAEQADGTYDVHGTAGGDRPQARFARKAGEIGAEITDDYAAGDWIKLAVCQRGVRVYAYLAAGETVSHDELLASGGDGTLVSAEDGTSPHGEDAAVARAAEAVDNGAGTTAVRIEVEVL